MELEQAHIAAVSSSLMPQPFASRQLTCSLPLCRCSPVHGQDLACLMTLAVTQQA